LAELSELKSIFQDCLPIGEHKEEVETRFNLLEEVICNHDYARGDPIQREQFDHDDPDVQYAYLSDALLKERSSRAELRAIRQDLADQPNVYEGQVPQPDSPVTPDHAPLSECPGERDLEYGEEDCDNSCW
jgi:hypothetical protein